MVSLPGAVGENSGS